MARRKNTSIRKASSSPSINLLKTSSQVSKSRGASVAGSNDLVRMAAGSRTSGKPIQFGSPSDKGSKNRGSKDNRGVWTGLLESVSTGGISDLLGGGGLLSSGLDYLSHGIQSLFGGTIESRTEPLTRFGLPNVQDQTITVSGMQSADRISHASSPGLSAYKDSQPGRLIQTSRAEIVQTIKNALLTSSSLNDVIGEL